MQLIALTGGIASGKSTIGRTLEELGAVRIDADQLAREAVASGSEGLERVIAHFGDEFRAADGSLDRPALGARVFGDPEALATLNSIVHPEVGKLQRERLEHIAARDPDAIVVYEHPLIAETGGTEGWDLIVVADAPAEQRLERLISLRGMSEAEARDRLARQASDAERRAIADVLIDTSGTPEHTNAQVEALWKRLTAA